jgi:pimeloyl-ACP methyl ester carboxylesterase
MAKLADQILLDAFGEVTLRDPSFLGRQAVGFAPMASLVERYRADPLFAGFDRSDIERRLTAAQALLAERGLQRSEDPEAHSRLAALFCDSAMDGLAAEAGLIGLTAPARRAEPLQQVLADDYDARTTASGVNYIVRRRGEKWLLVVNALGIPVGVWSRLLGDAGHDWRVLVVESGGGDLIKGGQSARSDLTSDTARIAQVLDAEGIESIAVVGWCSGGRIAVQLAADQPERVGSLVLTSASLRGAPGSDAAPTQFEEDISGVFDSVLRAPANAPFLSELLMNSSKLAQPPVDDGLLFRLPAQEKAADLIAPLATGEDLRNYSQRVVADKSHATAEALARVRAPILAMAGRHDHVISNAHTWQTLKAHARDVSCAVISASGHYVYDLQYPYFLMALEAFTASRPLVAARIGDLDHA